MRESFSELFPRRRIGRYEIVDRLGAGGMAEVLLAVRQGAVGFKKAVALKRILPQYARETQFVQMLAREAAIAAMMHHPNCVQITELEEDDGELFMAMELLYGVTLDELAELERDRGQMMPLGVAVRIATDAARGLHYVHGLRDETGLSLGVVHRDVSPQNLFVTEDGITKVLDFGIATAVEVLDGDTRTGALKGKYLYMAPEQVNFQPVDARTDVWGLAVTLWGMLVGKPLFRDAGVLEALETIRAGEIRPPSAFRPDVPKALDEVVLAALRRPVNERTRSADVLASQLERVAAELGSSSPQDVAAVIRSLASERIQYLRARAAAVLRVSEQIADASGAYRTDSQRKLVAVRRPDTLREPNEAHFAQTAIAQPVPTAVAMVKATPTRPGAPVTSVERPGRPGLGPPTLRDGEMPSDVVRIESREAAASSSSILRGESHEAGASSPSMSDIGSHEAGASSSSVLRGEWRETGAMPLAQLRPRSTASDETLTTPSKPIALGALAVSAPSSASEALESTDPVVQSRREPAAAIGATVVPATPSPRARSATPSLRSTTPSAGAGARSAAAGTPAPTTTLGSRAVGRARHPWWLDAVAIAVGIGAAWAVAEVLVR